MVGRPGIAEKRLSIHRFQQLPDQSGDHLKTQNDVTIDIPLTAVTSSGQTGARKSSVRTTPSQHGYQPPGEAADVAEDANEKAELGALGHRGKRIDSARARSLDDPEDGTITRMGRFYQRVLNFSIVTRYLIYVLPLSVLIAVPIIVGQTAAPDATIGGVGITWFFLWIEVVWWSLWVGKLVARVLPFVFQFLCGIVSSGTRKYALILQNLQFPIATVLWSVISLITFLPVCLQPAPFWTHPLIIMLDYATQSTAGSRRRQRRAVLGKVRQERALRAPSMQSDLPRRKGHRAAHLHQLPSQAI